MSDAPDKKHPWAKFRAAPGGSPAPRATPPRTPPTPLVPPAKPATPLAKPAIPVAKPVAPMARPAPPAPAARPMPPATPRPPMAPTTPSAPSPKAGAGSARTAPPAAGPTGGAGTVVSDDLAAALNKLAAEYAAPAVTSAPFITAMQREVEAREKKRASRRHLAKLAVMGLVILVALHFTITRLVYREPSVEAIEAHVQRLPELVLPLYSTARQPLQLGTVTFAETDRVSANRIRYAAQVTLILRKPLYLPASTNGTAAYQLLQQSLVVARERELKFNLFPPGEAPPLPELPRLIQVSHRAGEPLVIRVPFEARRFAWGWRLDPPVLGLRTVNRTLVGDPVEAFAEAPYLIFGAPGAMAELRQLMRQARNYVVAVAQEIQKHADVQAVVDKPKPEPGADPNAPATDTPAADPNKPALSLEDLRKLFDPNAPAVTDADKPAADPDAPATVKAAEPDPDAPAIKFDPNAKATPQKKRP